MNGEMTRAGTSRALNARGSAARKATRLASTTRADISGMPGSPPTNDAPVQTAAMSIVLRMTG